VMDRLKRTHFLEELNGEVFLSQSRAFEKLAADDGTSSSAEDPYLARGLI